MSKLPYISPAPKGKVFMPNQNKTNDMEKVIVSSAALLKYIQETAFEADEYIAFKLHDKVFRIGEGRREFSVEATGSFDYEYSGSKIKSLERILKSFSEQPIVIRFKSDDILIQEISV